MTFGRGRREGNVIARSAEVARRLARGESQATISRDIGVSQPTLSRVVAKLREEWREISNADFSAVQGGLIVQLQEVVRAAWQAFEESGNRDTSALAAVCRAVELQGKMFGVNDRAVSEHYRRINESVRLLADVLSDEITDPAQLERITDRIQSLNSGEPLPAIELSEESE